MTPIRYVEGRTRKLVAETMAHLARLANVSPEALREMSATEYQMRCDGVRAQSTRETVRP